MNKLAIALWLALSWPLLCLGQVRGSAGMAPGVGAPHMGISGGLTISFGRSPSPDHAFRHGVFPSGFFFDPGFWYEPAPDQPAVPSIVVVPIQVMPADKPEQEAKSVEPLLIERVGDRFVRSSSGETRADSFPADEESQLAGHREQTRRHDAELAPAVLVFRDGHREQTTNYAIVGSEIYLYLDRLTGGSWLRKIQLADLDLDATASANRERGSGFQLPRGPNEIVIRP